MPSLCDRAAAVTVRQALRSELESGPVTARDISQRLGISEKEVAAHMQHLDKSLRSEGNCVQIEAASCVECGYSFRKRSRMTRPGACPVCGGRRIAPPAFRIARRG
jgi:transcriptional regulator